MIKRFAYIVLLLIFALRLSFAATIKSSRYNFIIADHELHKNQFIRLLLDTTTAKKLKQQQEEEKKKIKEIAKAKRQLKPEKLDEKDDAASKAKPKRQRRPEGLERPPEIPRRNGN